MMKGLEVFLNRRFGRAIAVVATVTLVAAAFVLVGGRRVEARVEVHTRAGEVSAPVQGAAVLELLQELPAAVVAEEGEVLGFIERHALYGQGMGFVDIHLLASVLLTEGAMLWTRDQRLRFAAEALGLAFNDKPAH